jgi:ABC-2 type transport system permease protein
MTRSIRAELIKLRRPRVVYGGIAALLGFTLLATVLTFATAKVHPTTATGRVGQGGPTLGELAHASGLTRGFGFAGGLVGIVVFILFLTSITGEYGLGTLRVLLVWEPRRARLLGGKVVALLACVIVMLLIAELVSGGASILLAHARHISTAEWFTGTGMVHAASTYVNVVVTCMLYGVVAIAIGVIFRSTALALSVGLAWLLPLENILGSSWKAAANWLPGLLFGGISQGGNSAVTYQHAVILGVTYGVIAVLVAGFNFVRRDVTV